MSRFVAMAFVVLLVVSGCRQEQPPEKKPPEEKPLTNTHKLFGDRFIVDIETVGASSIKSYENNEEVGGQKTEFAELKWGGNTLKIDNGKLTFNDNEGDRIRVDKDSQLYINGKKHP